MARLRSDGKRKLRERSPKDSPEKSTLPSEVDQDEDGNIANKKDALIEVPAEPPTKKRRAEDPTDNKVEDNSKTEESINYWLMKAEPATRMVNGHDVKFGIDDLKECGESDWDGVRNHEAKNNMMAMKRGDLALFYHSNAPKNRPDLGPGIVGIMEIVNEEPIEDYSAFDKSHAYYDPKSSKDSPKWFMSRVKYVRKFKSVISLHEIKRLVAQEKVPELADFALVKRSRLSIVPVKKVEWDYILAMEGKDE